MNQNFLYILTLLTLSQNVQNQSNLINLIYSNYLKNDALFWTPLFKGKRKEPLAVMVEDAFFTY